MKFLKSLFLVIVILFQHFELLAEVPELTTMFYKQGERLPGYTDLADRTYKVGPDKFQFYKLNDKGDLLVRMWGNDYGPLLHIINQFYLLNSGSGLTQPVEIELYKNNVTQRLDGNADLEFSLRKGGKCTKHVSVSLSFAKFDPYEESKPSWIGDLYCGTPLNPFYSDPNACRKVGGLYAVLDINWPIMTKTEFIKKGNKYREAVKTCDDIQMLYVRSSILVEASSED